jgi:hypothetical protein
VPHSDTICRILFRPKQPALRRRRQPHGNQLIPVIPISRTPDTARRGFGGLPRCRLRIVLVTSRYAYQEAGWLVPAFSQTKHTANPTAPCVDAEATCTCPFTSADRIALAAACRWLRDQYAVRSLVATDYPTLQDAWQISWPGTDEVRWLVCRNSAGVWLEELGWEIDGPFATTAAALAKVTDTLDAETAVADSAIPAL